jgi:regulatory protein
MNDSSEERLAPVSYLPWAAPRDEHPAGGRGRAARMGVGAAPIDDAAVDDVERNGADPTDAELDVVEPNGATLAFDEAAPSTSPARIDQASSGRGFGERGRSRGFGRLGARSGSRLSLVGDDERPDETGAERDDRIDRLVVSRLRRSALSIAEVRAVLAEHGLDDAEIDEWIERYERLGYLDDARLAEQLTHSHGTRRGRGSSAILHELERRGIGGDVARAAVDGLDPEAEIVNATAVAERRARQLTGLDHATAERRLTAFLMRRGYPSSVVREAVTAALTADGS